jgi:type IV secretion system protein VirB1
MISAALLACAISVHPVALEAVIRVESGGDPLAINVNGLGVQPLPARDAEGAAAIAHTYLKRGYSVDIGLMQVNSRNLPALGYTVEQVLDPCTNIRAGGIILTEDYERAAQTYGEGQQALRAALSAYNTGDFQRGLFTYVARYYRPGAVPALSVPNQAAHAQAAANNQPSLGTDRLTAPTTVFIRESFDVSAQ